MSDPEDVSIATEVDPLLLFHGDEVGEKGLAKEDLDGGEEEDFVGDSIRMTSSGHAQQILWEFAAFYKQVLRGRF